MKSLRMMLAFMLVLSVHGVQAQTTVKYVHTDALGSVVALTDGSGSVVEGRREYEPYGYQTTPAIQDGPGYTGHVQDAATGLTYMQQRYYDPVIGVFLSVDPVTALSNPVAHFNVYRYANNNPYAFVDFDGRQSEERDRRSICNNRKCDAVVEVNSPSGGSGAGAASASGAVPTVADLNAPATLPPTTGKKIKQFGEDLADEAWNRWLPAMPGGATATTGVKVLVGGVMAIRLTRAINLPGWRKLSVDMAHIADGHMVGGTMTHGKSVFIGLNESGVRAAIRQAYGSASVVRHQGDRVLLSGTTHTGMKVEMWLNRSTNVIETAYPVVGR